MAIPLTLRVHRAGELIATREYHREIIKIGRLATAQLCLDDPRVSRIHAVIEAGADGFSITDMGSVEGTYVNGKRISKATLSSGDAILVGDTRIEFVAGVAAADETSTAEHVAPVEAPAAPVAPAVQASPVAVAAPEAVAAVEAPKVAAVEPAAPAPRNEAVAAGPANEALPNRVRPQVAVGASDRAFPLPVPWPREQGHRTLALDLRFFWGDKQLAAGSFADDETEITVGDVKDVSFTLEAGNLPGPAFPIARKVDGAWHVRFGATMDGELVHEGKVERLGDLARARKATPVGDGIAELELPTDGAVWVDLGNIRAELCFRPKSKALVVPLAQRIDYGFMNLFLAVFALFTAGIIAFNNTPRDLDVTADDLFSNQARFTKLLLTPPERRQSPFLEKLALQAPEGEGVKAPGAEGKAGRRDAPERNTRSAPKAIKPDDKEIIKNQGILSMLGSGGNSGLSTILGKGGLGGDLKGAIGGITGASVGDAHGFGGLGLKGTGLGGGGEGTTVGVGAIGTKGRGGGMGDYGKGAGDMGRKASSEVRIDNSSVLIVGYDRELVRRVVSSHNSQLRYCYENELIRNPKLEGRIAISWVITGDGSVAQASVSQTSMNNSKVENCLLARVRGWQFPPPKGGGIAKITYPFLFKPPAS